MGGSFSTSGNKKSTPNLRLFNSSRTNQRGPTIPPLPPVIRPQNVTLPASANLWTQSFNHYSQRPDDDFKSIFNSRIADNSRELDIKRNDERLTQIKRDRFASQVRQVIQQEAPISKQSSIFSLFDIRERLQSQRVQDDKYFAPKSKLPELTPQILEYIVNVSYPNPPNQLLIELDGVPIHRRDIQTLVGQNWLNDEVINAYMYLLVCRGKKIGKKRVYAFNTFFYPKLRDSNYNSVRRWTRKVDIFNHDILLVPVHLGNHWCLAVINFQRKSVSYYDSLGGGSNGCCRILLDYLKAESLDKKKLCFDYENWTTKEMYSEGIPKQKNCSDCGVFACTYAEYLTRPSKLDFEQNSMPYFRRKMIYEITKGIIME